jgi:hypothetical protein
MVAAWHIVACQAVFYADETNYMVASNDADCVGGGRGWLSLF